MDANRLIRLQRLAHQDAYIAKVIAGLVEDASLEHLHGCLPSQCIDPNYWGVISTIHVLVVANHPSQADHWMDLVVRDFLQHPDQYRSSHAHIQGAFLGFLRAGVLLDQEYAPPPEKWVKPPTAFQNRVLSVLGHLISGPLNLQTTAEFLRKGGYAVNLTKELQTFAFHAPEGLRGGRLLQLQAMMSRIIKDGKEENLSQLDRLVIDGLYDGCMSGRSSLDRLFVAHALFAIRPQLFCQVYGSVVENVDPDE